MPKPYTGAEIRQMFIQYFQQRGHTEVTSASLVPGGDQTLLFTNSGMVQFKEVFLGTDIRPYTRAVDSQKCMRVAGKHNDLDDVGRDNSHHTFFEMLGNWSFGDYYKKEAITWAWDLLTNVWGLDKDKLWTTCFKDDKGDIPTDEEAADNWRNQPGIIKEQVVYYGRKENFWEMADTGPCGPCSEIHIDLGPEYCDMKGEDHQCRVNGDCKRFLELWNLVFIQYNRHSQTKLEPLPSCHVDTGMGLERIVAILQGTNSNYKTDLLLPLMDTVLKLTGETEAERENNLTPYRVISDHTRAATFLIADGVVPGNIGRNYVCRMIIRRAAQFGRKIGLHEPFLAKVAETVIREYSDFYPELKKHQNTILDNFTREETRFRRTVDAGMNHLLNSLEELKKNGMKTLDGKTAFELYATHGLPFEISRDIAREEGYDVDEEGFRQAMDDHRLASGAGKEFGPLGGEDVNAYRATIDDLIANNKLGLKGVGYDPYNGGEVTGEVLAIFKDGKPVQSAQPGDVVDIVLPNTCFYVESGGQVSDSGSITSKIDPKWKIEIKNVYRPTAGVISHTGTVESGVPKTGDLASAKLNILRRQDIRRNHTATHLLHSELRSILGDHARQAGSLVSPEKLRFDFTHPEATSRDTLEKIEYRVNQAILENIPLNTAVKSLTQAISEGATALFGEKYGDEVRTITINGQEFRSYELCGGTHVRETGEIGLFLIINEGSAAAGVRRIEAVTGRAAYELVQKRLMILKASAGILNCGIDELPEKLSATLTEIDHLHKGLSSIRRESALTEFQQKLLTVTDISGIKVLSTMLSNCDADTLRQMSDRFHQTYSSGVVVLGSVIEDKPIIIASISEDLVRSGLHAGNLVKSISPIMGGSGGGKPTLAQAGGKDKDKLGEALEQVIQYIKDNIKGN